MNTNTAGSINSEMSFGRRTSGNTAFNPAFNRTAPTAIGQRTLSPAPHTSFSRQPSRETSRPLSPIRTGAPTSVAPSNRTTQGLSVGIGPNDQKLDINLNITVNNDGSISASTGTPQTPQFPRPSNAVQQIPLQGPSPQSSRMVGSRHVGGMVNNGQFIGGPGMINQGFMGPGVVVVNQEIRKGTRGGPGYPPPGYRPGNPMMQSINPNQSLLSASSSHVHLDSKLNNMLED